MSGPRRVSEVDQHFIQRLAVVRRAKGLTQDDVAQQARMDRSALARLECGGRSVTLGEAVALAAAVGEPLSVLLDAHPIAVLVGGES